MLYAEQIFGFDFSHYSRNSDGEEIPETYILATPM